MRNLGSVLRFSPLAVLALALSACGSTGTTTDKGGAAFSNDVAGDEPVPGVVRIVEVDRSALQTEGRVRYRLANLTRADVENLSARVTFYYPAREGAGIALPFETDVTEETAFVLFRGQEDYDLTATSRAFAERSEAGDQVLATEIDVLQAEPIPITARSGRASGTVLLDALECVAISPEDLRLGMDGAAPRLWFEFANTSGRPMNAVEMKVLFLDTLTKDVTGETTWQALPSFGPGESKRVEIDLAGAGQVRNRPFLVQMRFGSLIG